MGAQIRLRPAALRDIDRQVEYFASAAGPEMAIRYHEAIEATLQVLAREPQLGSYYRATNPRLADVRFWPVRGFGEHVVFYRDRPDAIEVVRVLHGKRDLDAVLA